MLPRSLALAALCCLTGAATAAADTILPNGRRITPAGQQIRIGQWPQAAVASPDGSHLLVVDAWQGPQSLEWIDTTTLTNQPVAPIDGTSGEPDPLAVVTSFTGMAFTADGSRVYVSGGNQQTVVAFDVTPAGLVQNSSASIAIPGAGLIGQIVLSPDGKTLYTVDSSRDTRALYAVDIASGAIRSTPLAGDRGYALLARGDRLYAGGMESGDLYELDPALHILRTTHIGAQPMAIAAAGDQLLVADANRDEIAVVDPEHLHVEQRIDVQMLSGGYGSRPSSIAVQGDRAVVTLSGLDALAVLERRHDRWEFRGAIPTGWSPSAVVLRDGVAWVTNLRGQNEWLPYAGLQSIGPSPILGLAGTLSRIDIDHEPLARDTEQVLANAYQDVPGGKVLSPDGPIKHVVFILRENKTFDADLGDTPGGDPRYVLFPRPNTPSLHGLADRFAVLTNMYADGEASDEGHEWATGGYVNGYVDRFWQARDGADTNVWGSGNDPIEYPEDGYIFDAAERAKITWRNFGEFMRKEQRGGPFRAELASHRNSEYPGWDQGIPDVQRAAIWRKEFTTTEMPAFSFVWLPNDHGLAVDDMTNPTLQQQVADNDRATGEVIDAISHSKYWPSTAIFLTEDDPQGTLDHVDGRRTVGMVISPWARRGTVGVHTDTAGMVRTMMMILGLKPTNQFTANARPLPEVFTDTPDFAPFDAPPQGVPATPPPPGALARAHAIAERVDHSGPDRVDVPTQRDYTYLSVHGMTLAQFARANRLRVDAAVEDED